MAGSRGASNTANPELARQLATWQETASGYLERDFQRGHVESLRGYAQSYLHGLVTDQDPVQALAFYYASAMHPDGSPGVIGVVGRLEAQLSEQQIAAAESRSAEILGECCGG